MTNLTKAQWKQINKNSKQDIAYFDPMNFKVELTSNQIMWMPTSGIDPVMIIDTLFNDLGDEEITEGLLLDLHFLDKHRTVCLNGYVEEICGQGYGAWMDGVVEGLMDHASFGHEVGWEGPSDEDWDMIRNICEAFVVAAIPFCRMVY